MKSHKKKKEIAGFEVLPVVVMKYFYFLGHNALKSAKHQLMLQRIMSPASLRLT
jgi:hypothetical protein